MLTHASVVSSERDEEKRRRDRTCAYCKAESVYSGKCSGCNRVQPGVKHKKAQDRLEWPPDSGNWYVGDKKEAAIVKLKKADPRGFMQYNEWVLRNAFTRR